MRWLALHYSFRLPFSCRRSVGTGDTIFLDLISGLEAKALVKPSEESSGTKVGFEYVCVG